LKAANWSQVTSLALWLFSVRLRTRSLANTIL
jgi:hypothetical protein